MNTENNRYVLERYRSGGSNRFTCPQCGRKKCFTRYVDVSTGSYLANDCGKCNHESSCGYHYPPRLLFREHPELRYEVENGKEMMNGKTLILKRSDTFVMAAPQVYHQTEFFPLQWAERSVDRQSTFRTWFMSLPFSDERKAEVLREYYLGGMAKDTIVQGVSYGPAAIFWMIDAEQRVHDAKMIAYTPDGHRLQNWGNSIRSVCEKTHQGPQLQWTEKVFYGLHLTARYPDRPVCIVESEKTALICACRYPEYVWLATGGCGNLQKEKLTPLMGRHLAIFPDSGVLEKWSNVMKTSGHKDYRIVEYLENYEPNTDIADVILGTARAIEL